jgi:very-short-patch-repair endonuclease
MSLDRDLRALAARQRCVFTTGQAFELGATHSMLQSRTRSGMLVRLAPRLLALGGVPETDDLLCFAAWLEAGGRSAISHETAAAHWRFVGFRTRPVQLVRLRDGVFPPSSLGTVHTTRELPDTQIVEVDGLAITTPARTLFDLAPRVHPGRLERLLDRAWANRLVNWRILNRTFRELQRRGRSGIAVMRELLEARPADYRPPESNLEFRLRQLLRDDGQAELDRQVDLGDDRGPAGRVDFVDRQAKVVVEVQSDLYHTSISDRLADRTRCENLESAGWTVLLVEEFDLWHRSAEVQSRIRGARSGR